MAEITGISSGSCNFVTNVQIDLAKGINNKTYTVAVGPTANCGALSVTSTITATDAFSGVSPSTDATSPYTFAYSTDNNNNHTGTVSFQLFEGGTARGVPYLMRGKTVSTGGCIPN